MRLSIVILALSLTACGTVDPMAVKKYQMGYKSYDPCIRCGEQWEQLPNWRHEAIIRTYILKQDY